MITNIILPLIRLLSIYHNFSALITYIPNKNLLLHCTVLTVFLQFVCVDQILPYNSNFNTKTFTIQYEYPLWQTYFTK